jgi:hypothetical protein
MFNRQQLAQKVREHGWASGKAVLDTILDGLVAEAVPKVAAARWDVERCVPRAACYVYAACCMLHGMACRLRRAGEATP